MFSSTHYQLNNYELAACCSARNDPQFTTRIFETFLKQRSAIVFLPSFSDVHAADCLRDSDRAEYRLSAIAILCEEVATPSVRIMP